MMVRTVRWLALWLLPIASAGLLTVMSIPQAAFAFGDEDDIAVIMGGTGAEGGGNA